MTTSTLPAGSTGSYYADSRVTYRADGGYTVAAHDDVFQVLYQPGCDWAICRGLHYAADPYPGRIADDLEVGQAAVVVGYESADAAIYILIGDPWS